MHLAPRRLARVATVFLAMPFAGPAKLHPAAVDDQTDRLAAGQAIGHALAALFNLNLEHAKPFAEQPEARHRDVQPAQRPEFLHMAGDLPHAPAEQPVEHENQFEVRIAVRLGLTRHALLVGCIVDEQCLQIAVGAVQAELPASLQALVVLVRVRYRIGRFGPFARFASLLSRLIRHESSPVG